MHHGELEKLVESYGYPGVFVSLTLESFGVPVPAESLLIVAFVFAGRGDLDPRLLFLVVWCAAVLGDNIGYLIGKLAGQRLLTRFGPAVGLTPPRLAKLEDRFRRGTMARSLDAIDAGALAHYRAFFTAPGRIAATCADYRAGAGIDLADDEADRAAGRKIACPTRAVWGETGNPSHMEDPLGLWRAWCDRVDGGTVPCGHFMAEEAPEATLDMVLPFLSGS